MAFGTVAGVDPGSNTGIVILSIDDPGNVSTWRFLGSCVVHASSSKKLSIAESDATVFDRVHAFVRKTTAAFAVAENPLPLDLCVLEEPSDAQTSWRGYTKQRRGTAFRLGAYYGLAVAAMSLNAKSMVSYPVTSSRDGKRLGWMQDRRARADKGSALGFAETILKALKVDVSALSEHELSAMGVLTYHLTKLGEQGPPGRFAGG